MEFGSFVGMTRPTVLWTLRHAGRSIICTEQPAANGLEVLVTYDSLPLAAQQCSRLEDAERWADDLRRRWEASGWSLTQATPVASAS